MRRQLTVGVRGNPCSAAQDARVVGEFDQEGGLDDPSTMAGAVWQHGHRIH